LALSGRLGAAPAGSGRGGSLLVFVALARAAGRVRLGDVFAAHVVAMHLLFGGADDRVEADPCSRLIRCSSWA
jgi:hypothetical protein